jgi:hypothetical protein
MGTQGHPLSAAQRESAAALPKQLCIAPWTSAEDRNWAQILVLRLELLLRREKASTACPESSLACPRSEGIDCPARRRPDESIDIQDVLLIDEVWSLPGGVSQRGRQRRPDNLFDEVGALRERGKDCLQLRAPHGLHGGRGWRGPMGRKLARLDAYAGPDGMLYDSGGRPGEILRPAECSCSTTWRKRRALRSWNGRRRTRSSRCSTPWHAVVLERLADGMAG